MQIRIHVYGDGSFDFRHWFCHHDDYTFRHKPSWWWFDLTEGAMG